ncbi:extracellular repeat protein, HAF family [Gemmatirosa kalamazoonensis]|uniref:Extracellular repeat protein, HAF family n=1 Tax=Gemmatirosa kalamazoonensis TaxID=861299 RepID=W0REM6_9BACT|nr:hypothetical protein [Gemmatirosa kalamazoonensis]AHG88775.1 extracellular repeat protein, HAF family [Gemmatirosa kalamazoonensis]
MRRTSLTLPCTIIVVVLIAACGDPDRVTAVPGRPAERLTAPTRPDTTALSASAVDVPAPPSYVGYVLTDISRRIASTATDINTAGLVVGAYATAAGQHGFVRHTDGTFEDLPPLAGDTGTVATGINDAGVVVGYSTRRNGHTTAWIRHPGLAPRALSEPEFCAGSSRADAIDYLGEIVGSCGRDAVIWPTETAFAWPLGGVHGEALDVYFHTVVGYGLLGSGSTTTAIVWRGAPTTFNLPPGSTDSKATGINAGGAIVGLFTQNGAQRGFVSSLTSGRVLPHPAYGISDYGRVVGWYVSLPAAAYTIAPGAVTETPLPPTTLGRVAVKVNRCGAIVGHYFPLGLQGGPRAALWTKPTCD